MERTSSPVDFSHFLLHCVAAAAAAAPAVLFAHADDYVHSLHGGEKKDENSVRKEREKRINGFNLICLNDIRMH